MEICDSVSAPTSIRGIITQLKAWFPPDAHKERDLPGGKKWFYIPWQLIRERFDEVCPDWEVSYSAPSYLGDYCAITCTISIGGISKQGVGNAEILLLSNSGKNMARGTPIERATADAFKNAAEVWGCARYLDEQTDPKKQAEFIRYMQHSGDGRAADFYHRNAGSLPTKKQRTSQSNPFGAGKASVSPIGGASNVITDSQVTRFWSIARSTGFSDDGVKRLLLSRGLESSKIIPKSAYDELCLRVGDRDVAAHYNQAIESSKMEF